MWSIYQNSPDEKLEQYARYLRVFFFFTKLMRSRFIKVHVTEYVNNKWMMKKKKLIIHLFAV